MWSILLGPQAQNVMRECYLRRTLGVNSVPVAYIRASMRDALQALLRDASDAKRSAEFWSAAAGILSDWAGGARLIIRYQGINESGSVHAGTDDRA